MKRVHGSIQELQTFEFLVRKMATAKSANCVPELRVERERSRLDLEQLTNFLDGGEMFTERRRELGKPLNTVNFLYLLNFL